MLFDVTVLGPDMAWAAGLYAEAAGLASGYVLRWDGAEWLVAFQHPGWAIFDIWAIGPSDIWAVGITNDALTRPPLALHWDGSSWTRIDPPKVGNRNQELEAVHASATDNVWAVGSYRNITSLSYLTYVVRWNGSRWDHVPLETPPNLWPVDVWTFGPNDTWVATDVGSVYHWDGGGWTEFPISVGSFAGRGSRRPLRLRQQRRASLERPNLGRHPGSRALLAGVPQCGSSARRRFGMGGPHDRAERRHEVAGRSRARRSDRVRGGAVRPGRANALGRAPESLPARDRRAAFADEAGGRIRQGLRPAWQARSVAPRGTARSGGPRVPPPCLRPLERSLFDPCPGRRRHPGTAGSTDTLRRFRVEKFEIHLTYLHPHLTTRRNRRPQPVTAPLSLP